MRLRLTVIGLFSFFLILWAARPAFVAQRKQPAAAAGENNSVSFLATFGCLRNGPEVYDGNLTVTGGKILRLVPWRFFQQDKISGETSWKLEVKRTVFENQPDRPNSIAGGSGPALNVVPAGVFVTVPGSSTSVEFQTKQGSFSVPGRQLQYGQVLQYLDGDVVVERVPAADRISPETKEQHDYPSRAVTKAGVVWTAWQAYEDRGDNVYVRQAGAAPVKLTTGKGDVYRTAIAEDPDGRMHAVWSERKDLDWNLYERVYDGNSWGARRQITNGNSPNMFHKLVPASAAGPLRLIWVGYEGGLSYLYVSSLDGGKWSQPQRIGGPSVWSPDASTDRQGNLYVAWDSYKNGNYDIFFRRLPLAGTPGEVEQVTSSPLFEAHASVAVDKQGRPWLAWDESGANWGKDWNHEDQNRATVLYANRSIKVVVKDGDKWKQAGDFSTAVSDRLRRYWQFPHLAVDGSGRVWALFQIRPAATSNREDYWCAGGMWELYLTTFENGVWRPAALVPDSSTRPEVPMQAVGTAAGVSMVWASDGRSFGQAGGFGQATMRQYDIFGAQASASRAAGAPVLNEAAEPARRRPARAQIMHPNEKQDVARIRGYRTSVDGTNYRILRGDFHRHTEISGDGAGDGSVEDYYRYMIDSAEMDTGIITDHNEGGDVEYNWWRTEKSYDLFHIRDRFTPLFGYERSVNYPNGHRNVVFDHRGVRTLPVTRDEQSGKVNSGSLVYPYLRQNRGICMEHSLATGQGTDYRDNDPELEPLVELYQGYHAAYEYEGAPRAENGTRHLLIHGGYE
ncbi:MAG: DUF3604 domain-containing protein, partial [Acidobacteria bacterium]|nr:DUF3604 domain-containing protein [Acidobacteriota bacterium]